MLTYITYIKRISTPHLNHLDSPKSILAFIYDDIQLLSITGFSYDLSTFI